MRTRLRELAAERRRFGYRRLHVLLRQEGFVINRKKTQRLYREEGLAVRRRSARRKAMGALLDRIVHNAYRLELDGQSMRKTKLKTGDDHPQN